MNKNAERAEKIFRMRAMFAADRVGQENIIAKIKQVLDEACAEEYQRGIKEGYDFALKPQGETVKVPTFESFIAREEGILEGLRMAAGIAMKFHERAGSCTCDPENIIGVVAEKIEAKARELSKKDDNNGNS